MATERRAMGGGGRFKEQGSASQKGKWPCRAECKGQRELARREAGLDGCPRLGGLQRLGT